MAVADDMIIDDCSDFDEEDFEFDDQKADQS